MRVTLRSFVPMQCRDLVMTMLVFSLLGCGAASNSPPPDNTAERDDDSPQTSAEPQDASANDATASDASFAPDVSPDTVPSGDTLLDIAGEGDGESDTGAELPSEVVLPDAEVTQDVTAPPTTDATDQDSAVDSAAAPDTDPEQSDTSLNGDATASDPFDELAVCDAGVIDAALAPQIPKSAGPGAFTPWDGDGWLGITGLMTALLGGDISGALAALSAVNYQACRGQGDEEGLLLFVPTESGTGHARAVWRLGAARPLVLEAPHPVFDMDTGIEAATLFGATQARGLIVSGTHRCVSDVPSGCDGKTKVCTGSSEPYPLTDMAHVGVSFFQAFHEAFQAGLEEVANVTNNWGYLLISVHGMAGDGISLSNGTTSEADVESLPAKLYLALKDALPDAYITSCNSFEGAVVDKRLCGSTNTQGRHTNGVGEVCTDAAPAASGHFAHMEQTLEIRQNPEPVIQALLEVFELVD